jgi:hypothetical protein
MSLLITKREAALITTNQAKVIIRAHRKVHYPQGAKLPLILDRESPSPLAIQVIGTKEGTLSGIDDARAQEAGFKNAAEFRAHWTTKLYGASGIEAGGGSDRISNDAHVVTYRFRRTDFVQKRLKVEP